MSESGSRRELTLKLVGNGQHGRTVMVDAPVQGESVRWAYTSVLEQLEQ